jgi:hypothetical protein
MPAAKQQETHRSEEMELWFNNFQLFDDAEKQHERLTETIVKNADGALLLR